MTENLTDKTLPDATHVDAAGSSAAVESSISLADLNKRLGKDFKDADSALKALADTQSYVGKRREDIVKEITPNVLPDAALQSDVLELKNRLFISENPQYKGQEEVLKSLNQNFAEAVKNEAFKQLFEKAAKADEVAQSKSVVASNARLSQERTTLDQAVTIANARGSTLEDVATTLARGILSQE